jgi:hypothetical protein
MKTSELDRTYHKICELKQRLADLNRNKDNTEGVVELQTTVRDVQQAFAHLTPGAWVAVVSNDYPVTVAGGREAPAKYLIPVSRFRGIESWFSTYDFGTITFKPNKSGARIISVQINAEQDSDLSAIDPGPFQLMLTFGQGLVGDFVELCVHETHEDTMTWLSEQPGEFFADVVEQDRARLRQKAQQA